VKTFNEKIKDAGFKSKTDFARYVGYTPAAIYGWRDKPPVIAERVIEQHAAILAALEVADRFVFSLYEGVNPTMQEIQNLRSTLRSAIAEAKGD